MADFTLWIITSDKQLADRWYRLFSRECISVQLADSLEILNKVGADAKAMALVEIGITDLKNAKDLKTFTSQHSNISAIVFGKQEKINNSVISEFLEAGADDFFNTEIDERVLLSKTRAHLRRLLPSLTCAKTLLVSRQGDIELDKTRRTVRTGLKNKKPDAIENLTPKEFEIFALLLSNEDKVISRDMLMEEVWREKSGKVNLETIDKHVETLRSKLGNYGKNIKTVYGAGYTYKNGNS